MGVDFHAAIFYGIEFDDVPEDMWELTDEFNEGSEVLEIINIDPMGYGKYVIFVKASYISCGMYDDPILFRVNTATSRSEPFWDSLIENACNTWEFDFTEPSWHFVTFYS